MMCVVAMLKFLRFIVSVIDCQASNMRSLLVFLLAALVIIKTGKIAIKIQLNISYIPSIEYRYTNSNDGVRISLNTIIQGCFDVDFCCRNCFPQIALLV